MPRRSTLASHASNRNWPKLLLHQFVVLTFLATGCVVNSENADQSEEDSRKEETQEENGTAPEFNEPIASSTSSSTQLGSDLQIDIYALESLSPGLLRLRFGVTNNSDTNFNLSFGLTNEDKPNTPSRVSLIDTVNQQRLLSYEQSDGSCFCSSWDGNIPKNSTEEMWAAFPLPNSEDVDHMTITTPLTPPFIDIPITDSTETLENTNLAAPEILDLTFISEETENKTGRSESGDEVSVILSSDVLFETDSSDLTASAQEILEEVATEVSDSSTNIVSIEGHADNTGSEPRNTTLSLERADSVKELLTELVTDKDISFETEGHGSADPIADNDTEEGRERNRRVTVTFER